MKSACVGVLSIIERPSFTPIQKKQAKLEFCIFSSFSFLDTMLEPS